MEDVKNPCPAALDLPLEERARRAGLQTVPVSLMGSSSTHEKQPHVSAMSSKRKLEQPHKSSHKHKRRRASQDSPSTSTHPPSSPVQDSVGEDLHVQLLAAIRGLTDRVANLESHPPQSESDHSARPSPGHLPSFQQQQARHPDAVSLYAHGSLLGDEQYQGDVEIEHSDVSSRPGGSTSAGDGAEEASAVDLVGRVLTAAKIVGLPIPREDAGPAEGVWAGITQPRPTVSLPAADGFCQMLRKAWNTPGKAPQFNAGCRKLAKAPYPPETGLGDMPPVEKEMAALTSLGPLRLTANPHCPRRECDKTDRLVSKAYNASARAARSGNALAVLLAAVRKSTGTDDQDTKELLDAALSALAQMTRDIGSAMSSATLARRQVWLAQTALPEVVKRELINMPVQPGNVFHPNSQATLDKAQESWRTRESVRWTFRRPAPRTAGRQRMHTLTWRPQGPWSGSTRRDTVRQNPVQSVRYQTQNQPQSVAGRLPQRGRPPRGPRTRGGHT